MRIGTGKVWIRFKINIRRGFRDWEILFQQSEGDDFDLTDSSESVLQSLVNFNDSFL